MVPLDPLSVADLRNYISELQAEILRVPRRRYEKKDATRGGLRIVFSERS